MAVSLDASTPILDQLSPLPPAKGPGSILGVVLLGLAIAAAIVLPAWFAFGDHLPLERLRRWVHELEEQLASQDWTARRAIVIGGAAALLGFAVVAIHELGHVVAGLSVGFRFHSMAIGPLQLDRTFRPSRHRGPAAWMRGWVRLIPARTGMSTGRSIVMVAGGPAASLVSAAAVLLMPHTKGLLSAVFVISSAAGGLVELLPLGNRALAFDGWRIWMLLRNRKWGKRWLALMRLGEQVETGVLPEAWSDDDLAAAVAVDDDSTDALAGHAYAYGTAFHRHHDEEAALHLEACLRLAAHATSVARHALMSDAAVFQARRRGRVDLAERWAALLPAATPAWLRQRAEAAVLEARGDFEGARRKLDETEQVLPVPVDSARRRASLQLLARWKSELDARADG